MSSKEELYKMLLESSPYGTLFFAYGVCIDCNPSATEILGCGKRQVLGTSIDEISPEEPISLASLKQCLQTAVAEKRERMLWKLKDGAREETVELILRPVGGARNELVVTLFPILNGSSFHDREMDKEGASSAPGRSLPPGIGSGGTGERARVVAVQKKAKTSQADTLVAAIDPEGASIIAKLTGRQTAAPATVASPRYRVDPELYYDNLTRLPNRQLLIETIREYLGGRKPGHCAAVLMVDVDHFKDINDSWGHTVGDQVIRKVGMALNRLTSESSMVARLTGDEFMIFLPDIAENLADAAANARISAERVKEMISHPIFHDGQEFILTSSVGVALLNGDQISAERALQYADTAMYEAKRKGRNGIAFFDPGIAEKAQRQVGLNTKLRKAVDNQEFVLYVQPQISVKTGQVVGGEALLRWVNSDRITNMPSEFIPLLEASGLIVDVGHWVIRTGCEYIRSFIDDGLWADHMRLGINVSPRQFNDPQLLEVIEHSLKSYEIDPKFLNFEVTESLVIEDVEDAVHKMRRIKDLGSMFSIDDFGIGYSSMIYLKRLPFDQLKIDREFIRHIHSDPESRGVVEAIMAVSRQYGLHVTAEGVEDDRSLNVLQRVGCDNYQGAYFSMPVTVDSFRHMLAA